MRWGLYGLAGLLAAQAIAPIPVQGFARDKPRRAEAREAAAPSQPARPPPGAAAPRPSVAQPVTPATDYYPYDRRTGGM